jgi:hypothetical protein
MQDCKRFALSEISNIDQTPISFKFLSLKTYLSKGLILYRLKLCEVDGIRDRLHFKFYYMLMENYSLNHC